MLFLKKIVLSFLVIFSIAVKSYTQECNCDYVLESEAQNVDGIEMGLEPGDTICIKGGNYGAFKWVNIEGTEENPIVIRNCDGQVSMSGTSYGWKWQSSKHFKIFGDGDSRFDYGFRVTTASSFFVSMEYFTTDFEIAYIEVVGYETGKPSLYSGFAGIAMKTSPYVDCDLFQQKDVWIMKNISVHNNYIHKMSGEGIYAGHGFHKGRQEDRCPDGVKTYPHPIHNLHVYNNKIEDVGWDGIQIKNATINASVHDNTVYNFGFLNHIAHNEGLLIGESTEGEFYNNRIEKGTGVGIWVNAYGNSKFYNNVVIDVGSYGVYINNQNVNIENKEGTFDFFHNTFVNMGNSVFRSFTPQDIVLKNNLFINYDGVLYEAKQPITEGNIYSNKIDTIGFSNPGSSDYSLLLNSPAINAGVSVTDVSFDIDNNPRDDGKNDVGAYEYAPAKPKITIVPDEDIRVEPGEHVTVEVALSDSFSEVEKVQYLLNGTIVGSAILPAEIPYTIDASVLHLGINAFQAKAITFDGDTIETRTINILVAVYAPEITIVSPISDIEVDLGTGVEVEVNLLDEGATVEKIHYVLNGEIIGTDILPNPTTHTIAANKLNLGDNEFYVMAVSFDDVITESESINIPVILPKPIISLVSPSSIIEIEPDSSVTIEIAITDEYSQVDLVQYVLDGTVINTVEPTPLAPYHIPSTLLDLGDHEFYALAITLDGNIISTNSIHILIAYPDPEISLTSPTSDILVEPGVSIKVVASLLDEHGQVERVIYILNGKGIGQDILPKPIEHTIGGNRLNLGNNQFYARAVTFEGENVETETINILVAYPTPEIFLKSPTSDIEIESNVNLRVEVGLEDAYDQVEKVHYELNGKVIGTDILPNATEHMIAATKLNLGYNEFRAMAVTLIGDVIYTESMHINVVFTDSTGSRSSEILEQEEHAFKVDVYPNPAGDQLWIKAGNLEAASYELQTITGQIIKFGNINNRNMNNIVPITLTDLSPGVYFLRILSKGKGIIRKVVKE